MTGITKVDSSISPKPATSMMCRVLMAAVLWLLSGLAAAMAGLSAPSSNATLSADGKRILVMISPVLDYDNLYPVHFTLPDGRSIILHKTFPKSGAYDSATLAPIWQCDWFALKDDLLWSGDFTDIVRLNPFGLTSDWALVFYHEGRLVRHYDCHYLLTGFRHRLFLPYTTWDWHYVWNDAFKLDGNHVVLSTARRQFYLAGHKLDLGLKEYYVFDLSTGAVLKRSATGVWCIWAYVAILPASILAILCVFLFRLAFRRRTEMV